MFRLKVKLLLLSCVTLLASTSVNAQLIELVNGRSANLESITQLSADAGLVISDDYQYVGGRVNYKVAPSVLVFGDIGLLEVGDADGLTFGGGGYYQIQGIAQNFDTAVKASFHAGEIEVGSFEIDVSGFNFQFIGSSKKTIGETNFRWYSNIGIHQIELNDSDDSEFGIGAGVFSPAPFGEFFFGLDFIDEIIISGGARYNF